METLAFTNKDVRPTNELILSVIGEYSQYWVNFFDAISKTYPDAEPIWNYYNDGKSWLLKTVRKKKTLFWTGVFPGTFNVTFYFGDKAADLIEKSTISDELKYQYKNGKRYGKIRSISIKMLSESDVENALKVTDLKIRSK
jgi:hypothetical protein